MKLIDRYLGLEWAKWFALSMFFLFAVLFLQALSDDPDFARSLLEQEGRGKGLAWFLGYAPWVLPVSCFVATVTSLSFLSKNRELLALRASGFSSFGLSRPYLLSGAILSLLCWQAVNYRAHNQASNNQLEKVMPLDSFRMKIGKERIWYFGEFDEASWRGTGVHVYSYDENGSDSYRIRAETASRVGSDWIFENGRFLGFPSGKGLPVPNESGKGLNWEEPPAHLESLIQGRSSPRINKRFSSLRLSLPSDDPRIHVALCKKPASLSYDELTTVIENYPHQSSTSLYPYRLRKAQLAGSAPSCLLAVLCGLAVGLRKKTSSAGSMAGIALLGAFLFYLMKTFCDALGERGIVSGWVAVAIPYFFVVAGSFCLLLRNR